MTVTSDAVSEVKRSLQAGRKKDASRLLNESLDFSQRECSVLLRMLEEEIRLQDKVYGPSYKKPALDNPLMVTTLTQLWGRGDRLKAIELAKENHPISLADCIAFLEGTQENYRPPTPSGLKDSVRSRMGYLIWIPIALGLAFLGFAAYKVFQQERIISGGERVSGKVVDMHSEYRGGNAPIIAYKWDDEEHLYQSPIHSRNTPYSVGEEVLLYVNRDNPEKVIIDTFTDRWATPGVFALVGAVAWIAAVAVIAFNRKIN